MVANNIELHFYTGKQIKGWNQHSDYILAAMRKLETGCLGIDANKCLNARFDENSLNIIARLNREIVSSATCLDVGGKKMILGICVKDEFRGMGIGTRILGHLKASYTDNLAVFVRDSNEAAHHFFQKNLFYSSGGVKEGYYGKGVEYLTFEFDHFNEHKALILHRQSFLKAPPLPGVDSK